MTSVAVNHGPNERQSPLGYQAVIQTKDASLGRVFWGAVTSHGIEEHAVVRITEAKHQPVELEITLVAERTDDTTRQFVERLSTLSCYGVRVRLR